MPTGLLPSYVVIVASTQPSSAENRKADILPSTCRLRPPRHLPRASSTVSIFVGFVGVQSTTAFPVSSSTEQSLWQTLDRNQLPKKARTDPKALLTDLRSNPGVDTALGLPPGPNSGLSARLP